MHHGRCDTRVAKLVQHQAERIAANRFAVDERDDPLQVGHPDDRIMTGAFDRDYDENGPVTMLDDRPTIGRDEITVAAGTIADHVRRTPTITVPGRDLGVDVDIVLKLEFLQHSGSFKARGAAHAILTSDIDDSGVVAASGGNHGAAVAWAAQRFGHTAHVFVPTTSSSVKVARLRQYAANVHQVGAVYSEAYAASQAHLGDHGGTSIHAYDDPVVMAGAGTCARELDRQAPGLDAVLLACGGGGLSGGCAAWFGDRAEIVAVETVGTATYARALDAGAPVDIPVSGLVADSLGATRLGATPWKALRAAGATSVVVDDADVTAACALLWTWLRIVVEPAAAAPIAAISTGAWRPSGRRVGVVLCGANISIELPTSAAGEEPAHPHEAD